MSGFDEFFGYTPLAFKNKEKMGSCCSEPRITIDVQVGCASLHR